VLCQKNEPPWEFLLSASRNSLHSYELSRLGHSANLRKEIGALLDQWLEENACAMLARWLIEQRERPPRSSDSSAIEGPIPSDEPRNVSDNVFADSPGHPGRRSQPGMR
jgi:hypothetical protein